MPQYLRIIRKAKNNTRIELLDHTTTLIPTASLPLWDMVNSLEKSKAGISTEPKGKVKKEPKPKVRVNKGKWAYRNLSNGLGVDHPYENVDMRYTPVIFEGAIEAPF